MLDVYDILEYVRITQALEGALSGHDFSSALSDYLRRKTLSMATRSKIAVHLRFMDEDPLGVNSMERKLYRAVYVHWDGHPESRYPLLRQYYNSEEAARSIVETGDMSSLATTLKESVVYGPEDATGPNDYDSFKDLVAGARESMGEYLYLWDNGKWHVYSLNFSGDNGKDETSKCEMTWNNGGYDAVLKTYEGDKDEADV